MSAEKDAALIDCAGCGVTTTEDAKYDSGWRFTDAPWCPKCGWPA